MSYMGKRLFWRNRCTRGKQHTVSAFDITLGKLCVKSTHGLISTAPAGCGRPRSLKTVRAVKQREAPAESPANTSFEGGTGL